MTTPVARTPIAGAIQPFGRYVAVVESVTVTPSNDFVIDPIWIEPVVTDPQPNDGATLAMDPGVKLVEALPADAVTSPVVGLMSRLVDDAFFPEIVNEFDTVMVPEAR